MADVTNILIKAILEAVVSKSGNLLPGEFVGDLSAGLGRLEGLGAQTMQVLGDINVDAGSLGKTAKDIGDVGKDIGKEVGKGLGDIFGKKKEAEKEE